MVHGATVLDLLIPPVSKLWLRCGEHDSKEMLDASRGSRDLLRHRAGAYICHVEQRPICRSAPLTWLRHGELASKEAGPLPQESRIFSDTGLGGLMSAKLIGANRLVRTKLTIPNDILHAERDISGA